MHEAYSKYGSITAGGIERLRVKHRLRVVQNLEDGLGRNIVRSIQADGFFSPDHLMACYKKLKFVQNEKLYLLLIKYD